MGIAAAGDQSGRHASHVHHDAHASHQSLPTGGLGRCAYRNHWRTGGRLRSRRTQTIEVLSDALGQARAEIFQTKTAAGTNTISVQVIRPGDWPGEYGTRLIVGSGTTQKTWSSPDLSIRSIGPAQSSLGATLSYRFEVRNAGTQTVKDAVVTFPVPQGLTLLATNPPATQTTRQCRPAAGCYATASPSFKYCVAAGGFAARRNPSLASQLPCGPPREHH